MKKIGVLLCVLLTVCSVLFAEDEDFRFKSTKSKKEFDVTYYKYPQMKDITKKVAKNLPVTQAFSIEADGVKGEILYHLYTDTDKEMGPSDAFFKIWTMNKTNDLAQSKMAYSQISNYKNEDVKEEFNGDMGQTIFLVGCNNEYARGYKYMICEYFYKYNQGILMRTFLFDDLRFIGMNEDGNISPNSPYQFFYHSFRFDD